MPLTRQEIVDFALRYDTEADRADFPVSGDLFCFLVRDLPPGRVLEEEEGWRFSGYGLCDGYELDEEAKPGGKWIWFSFVSLSCFPPRKESMKLQPPHVVLGRIQNPARTTETRILRIERDLREGPWQTPQEQRLLRDGDNGGKILPFPTS